MSIGLELIKSVYVEEEYGFINEIEKHFKYKYNFRICNPIDLINEPDFVFSSEKIILYLKFKHLKEYQSYLPNNKEFNIYYLLLNIPYERQENFFPFIS